MARTRGRKGRIHVKDMKYRNDPMIRLYDRTQDYLQEKGRPIVIALGVIAAAVVLYIAWDLFSSYRADKAKVAYAEADEKANATVSDPTATPPPNQTGKVYDDERVKWQETAEAFERVANDYSGYYGAMARYRAGAAYLNFDRDKGTQLLQQTVAKNERPASELARVALAENYMSNGEPEKAIAEYKELLNAPGMNQVAQLGLAQAYEKAGNTEQAVEAYFEVAKENRTSAAGQKAEERLRALAPERLKELPVSDQIPFPEP
ncbi:MAG TPA: tetratricopeptide repeat protein [Blastocatellia bacterium]|nr:tetratricopeptide repeat protein [Blastocatellia bacterium]